ncbi:MAG: hypothetical protein K1X92_14505 [Bacteroidia bacterium]|nr:hypothetical protein [Bacteroidia bacterium]
MKKGVTFLFMLVYLVYCNGVNIHLHYCGENIASVSAFIPWGGCMCEDSSEEETDDCCKDEIKSVKSGESHATSPLLSLQQPSFPVQDNVLPDLAFQFPSSALIQTKENKPPPKSEEPLYLLHCVFII